MNLDKIKEIKEKYENEWMKYDDVFGIGIGYKTIGGITTDEVGILVYTTRKKPLDAIPMGQRMPRMVQNIPLDVVQGKPPEFFEEPMGIKNEQNQEDINMYRPMVGGIQISHLKSQTEIGYIISLGTLGMFVKSKDDPDNLYMLTNWHVLEKPQMDIYQPMYDGSRSSEVLVAVATKGDYYECADAAIAKVLLSREEINANKIAEIGTINAIDEKEPQLNQLVKKRGRTTFLTHGKIVDIDMTVSNGTNIFKHQVMASSIDEQGIKIAGNGDSGSIVLTYNEEIQEKNNTVLGILWGGNEQSNYFVYSPINYVFKYLNIELCES